MRIASLKNTKFPGEDVPCREGQPARRVYLRCMPLLLTDFWSFTAVFWWVFVLVMGGIAVWFFSMLLRQKRGSQGDLAKQLDIIEHFSKSVFRQNTPEDIVWDIAASCIEQLGLEDCVIYLKDARRQVWVQKAAFGPKNIDYRAIHEPIDLGFGQGIVGRVGARGVAEIVHDTSRDPDYVVDDAVRGSEMAVPILCDGGVIGVIDSEHTMPGFFKPFHLKVLQNVANICGQKVGRSLGEERLAEFARFFQINPNPVMRLGLEGKVMLANDASREAFGPDVQEGQRLTPKHALWASLTEAMTGRTVARFQVDMDGRAFQVTSSRVDDKPFYHVYAVDVTELEKARERAAAAEQHKSEFLSVMSHEIRTPLNAILGLTDVLIQGNVPAEDQIAHLSYMQFAGKHLKGLLTDVLDLERLGSGKAQPKAVKFESRGVLERVAEGFASRAEATGNTLTMRVADSVPKVLLGDVGWLVQILNNLLANALKFTAEGQVRCEATWDEISGLRLAVRDTGAGIPKADLERILLPFEQSTKEELRVANEGVGLGLAITKRLIELQQGEFQVESTLGEGSTFVVCLPLGVPEGNEGWWSPDQGEDGQNEPSQRPKPDAPVLVVDDNELNILVARRMLENWGYAVEVASSADEAELQMAERLPFLVLLDVHMPGRSGDEAARAWRSGDQPWASLPIIALTADAEASTKQLAQSAGMNDVVVKPFNPAHLRSLVELYAGAGVA
jgi:signal transduction histidine kinase/CheY-like chemotaxis protein